jgi:hypothetical protein
MTIYNYNSCNDGIITIIIIIDYNYTILINSLMALLYHKYYNSILVWLLIVTTLDYYDVLIDLQKI